MSGMDMIFISHTHEDNDRCQPLLAALDAWSVRYWFDRESVTVGADLDNHIQQALRESNVLLRVCTAATNKSYWMHLETAAFRGLQAEEHNAGQPSKRLLISLILDKGYVREPFDYAYIFIDATEKEPRSWLPELAHALGISVSRRSPSGSPYRRPVMYGDAVALRAANGNYVSADLSHDATLLATASHIQSWEMFEIIDATEPDSLDRSKPVRYGDQIALRATSNGKFIGADLGSHKELTARVPWVRGWESFVLTRPPQSLCDSASERLESVGCFALKAANGKFVSCLLDTDQSLAAVGNALKGREVFHVEFPS